MTLDLASVKDEDNPTATSGVPGQFGLLTRLVADMFEEVRIDLAGDAASRGRIPVRAGVVGDSTRPARTVLYNQNSFCPYA